MTEDEQGAVLEKNEEVPSEGTDFAWMRRHLSDSIYLWACGEKADNEDDAPRLSDRLLGWLILFMQGFAYTMLIVLARATSESDTSSGGDDAGDSGHLLPSVTGAIYLLIASTAHDLCAGFSLLVNGLCAGHRAFGVGLLVVHGIMTSAAMTVLVSTSDDSASVVVNAVTVLFIADLDEKALKLFLTIPRKWRLFWAIESIGISFALALVAIVYFGDSSLLLQKNNDILKTFPTWFVWGTNPIAVTLSSVLFTSSVEAVGEFWEEAWKTVDKTTPRSLVGNVIVGLVAAMKRGFGLLREEPCFYVALGLWFVHTFACVFFFAGTDDFPIGFTFVPIESSTEEYNVGLSDNVLAFAYVNVLLAIGLTAKMFVVCLPIHEKISPGPDKPSPSHDTGRDAKWGICAGSRAPSLLVGWGFGYWANSLLYLLCCAWDGGGWKNAPVVVRIAGYVIGPSFLFACILMFADPDILGKKCGSFFMPAVGILRNRRGVAFWSMASVLRDILTFWMGKCIAWSGLLYYYWL